MFNIKRVVLIFFFSLGSFLLLCYLFSLDLLQRPSVWSLLSKIIIYVLTGVISLVGIIVLIKFLYIFCVKKDRARYSSASFRLIIIGVLLFNLLLSKQIANQFFPDPVTRINVELNEEKIDGSIPLDDMRQIRELAKRVSNDKILKIKYYSDCKKPESEISKSWGPLPSKKCIEGDIELVVGYHRYCGDLCGEYRTHHYLLRKIEDEWQIIEDLGETGFIS